MSHCQVMVKDESGRMFSFLDDEGRTVYAHETHYCKELPVFVCDSGFKFCKSHRKSHGTTGKDGHTHTFRKFKVKA